MIEFRFEDLGAFLAMGGYAVYVWPSVLLFLAVILGDWLLTARRGRAALERARQRIAERARSEGRS